MWFPLIIKPYFIKHFMSEYSERVNKLLNTKYFKIDDYLTSYIG